MSWSLDGKSIGSALVTRLRYLGDVAMSTVVLRVLRDGDPDLRLGFLCESNHAPVLADHPDLDRRHELSVKRKGADAVARADGLEPGSTGDARGTLGTIAELRRAKYDLAVDLFFNPRSALLLRLAGVPMRIGGARGSRGRLYTHFAAAPDVVADQDFRRLAPGGLGDHISRLFPLRHEPDGLSFRDWFLERYADGGPRPDIVAPVAAAATVKVLAGLGVEPGSGYVLLAPGATWPAKQWPADRWPKLAALLWERFELPVVALSPPGDPDPVSGFVTAAGGFTGGVLTELALREALAVVAGASLVVSVDGGIMHAAVAMGRPTVALFGPTLPEIWFPYERMGPFRVLCTRPDCHPCNVHDCNDFICLPAISPEIVTAAGGAVMEAGAARGGSG